MLMVGGGRSILHAMATRLDEPGAALSGLTDEDRKALHDALDALIDAEAAREAQIDVLREQLARAKEDMTAFIKAADEAIIRSERMLASDPPATRRPGPMPAGGWNL
jgi:NAD(P)-dependent dehydrogenase (short-subunit alcohol dehydrogenase family)